WRTFYCFLGRRAACQATGQELARSAPPDARIPLPQFPAVTLTCAPTPRSSALSGRTLLVDSCRSVRRGGHSRRSAECITEEYVGVAEVESAGGEDGVGERLDRAARRLEKLSTQATAGRSHNRPRTARPIVNALHCQRPLFSRLILHQKAGRYCCRASKPNPTNSKSAKATINSRRSNRSDLVNCVRRNAQPLRRLLS